MAELQQKKPNAEIDKFTFVGSLILILAVTLPLIIFPEQGKEWVAAIKTFVTDKFGWGYLLFGFIALLLLFIFRCRILGKLNSVTLKINQNLAPSRGLQ